jgi:hypothetical protein
MYSLQLAIWLGVDRTRPVWSMPPCLQIEPCASTPRPGLEKMDPAKCVQTFSATTIYGYSTVLFVVD